MTVLEGVPIIFDMCRATQFIVDESWGLSGARGTMS